jgi:hypothetical protein
VCGVWRYCTSGISHTLQSRVTGFLVAHATAPSCPGSNAEYEDPRHFSRTSAVIKDEDIKAWTSAILFNQSGNVAPKRVRMRSVVSS